VDFAELFIRLGPFNGDDDVVRKLAVLVARDERLRCRIDEVLRSAPRCDCTFEHSVPPGRWPRSFAAMSASRSADQHFDFERAERAAQALLDSVPGFVWDGVRLPVPVEDIADSVLCLRVRDVADPSAAPGLPAELRGQRISGLLLPDRGEIWVAQDEALQWPARRRFTIGHEIGHWELHRERHLPVFCRSEALAELAPGSHGHAAPPFTGGRAPASGDPAAAATGKPAHPDTGGGGGGELHPQREHEANAFAAALLMPAELLRHHYERLRTSESPSLFADLCALFDVSGKALERRLAVLGLASASE
jgi:hypothetical protein